CHVSALHSLLARFAGRFIGVGPCRRGHTLRHRRCDAKRIGATDPKCGPKSPRRTTMVPTAVSPQDAATPSVCLPSASRGYAHPHSAALVPVSIGARQISLARTPRRAVSTPPNLV